MPRKIRNTILKYLSYFFFLGIGVFLFIKAFQNKDLNKVYETLKTVDPFWIIIVFLISIFCHVIRAMRWRMQLKVTGGELSFAYVYHCMMFGYFVNQAVPRLGEVSRSVALRRKNKASFNVTFGTVIMEKLLDSLVLFIISIIVIITNYSFFESVYRDQFKPMIHHAKQTSQLDELIFFGAICFIVITLVAYFLFKEKVRRVFHFAFVFLSQVWSGALSIKSIKRLNIFLLYTLIIWVTYFLMSYLCFLAFDDTAHLGIGVGFIVLASASIARVLPIQFGGFGAFHIVVSIVVYEASNKTVDPNTALALAFVIHGIQMLFYAASGVISSYFVVRERARS